MKRTIIINGRAGIGKDKLIEICKDLAPNLPILNVSSVDKVKFAARLLGWDGKKDEIGRQFLSDLKDLATERYDGPYKAMMEVWNNAPDDALIFIHIREPSEIEKLKQSTNATTLLMVGNRDGMAEFTNHADQRVEAYVYDSVFDNSGTLKALEDFAQLLLTKVTSPCQ